jgi:hypothetical protein
MVCRETPPQFEQVVAGAWNGMDIINHDNKDLQTGEFLVRALLCFISSRIW